MTAAGDRLIIVADGPSAAGFVPPDGVPIMAVKGAILWLPRADYWFSLDPNARTFAMLARRRPACATLPRCRPRSSYPRASSASSASLPSQTAPRCRRTIAAQSGGRGDSGR